MTTVVSGECFLEYFLENIALAIMYSLQALIPSYNKAKKNTATQAATISV